MATAAPAALDAPALSGPRPAPADQGRPNVVVVGTFLAIAAGIVLFGGLLGAYAAAREAAEAEGLAWPPESVRIPNVPLAMAYFTLLLSSFTAQWSVAAIKANARTQVYVAVGVTLMLGLAFVNALTFCWGQLGMVAGEDAFADTVYAVTVTHLVVVVVAHVVFLVMGFRALGGQFGPRNFELIDCAAAFWHFAVAAGLVVWGTIFFLEGGP